MSEDQPRVGQSCGDHARAGRLTRLYGPGHPVERPQDERIEDEGVELGERIPPHVDVDQMKRREGVSERRQPRRPASAGEAARPAVHRQGRRDETQRLRQFDSAQDVPADQDERPRQVIGQRGVIVEERISQPIGRVGHPTRGEGAGPQVNRHLVGALEEEGAIAAAPGVDHARPPERRGGEEGRQDQRRRRDWQALQAVH